MLSFLHSLLCCKTKKHADMDVLQVTLSDILEHFNGSKEESVVDLLSCLESDFLIYKKKNVYRVM